MKYDVFNDVDRVWQARVQARSRREMLLKLGLTVGSRTYIRLHEVCDRLGIDLDFDTPNWRSAGLRVPDELIFRADSAYTNNRVPLKSRYLEATGNENRCVLCGLGDEWNGQPLVLQLDHINGVNNDHRIENLRILCPNCHTQTDTYAGRSRKKAA